MGLYCGIDLHSNNHVLTVIDEADRKVYERRLPNDLAITKAALEPYRAELMAVAVESTFNWYWLVDGLMEAGYAVRLVNTAAVRQYEGLKHADDEHDAFWLAHLMRLGILPTGYIYPKSERGLRDLARQRMRLVQHRSSLITSVQNQVWRSTAVRLRSDTIKGRGKQPWPQICDPDVTLSIKAGRAAIDTLTVQIERLEKLLLKRLDLSLRCVDSQRLSNGKKKGEANRKCGNRYLAWAFMEAAHFAIRILPVAKRFYERKRRQRHALLAVKALAHKLARACFYVLRDQVPFAPERLFV